MKQRIHRLSAAALALMIIIVCVSGCSQKVEPPFDSASITSLHDIPGLTDDEIAKIEALLATRQSFTYGSLYSNEMFLMPDETYAGFAPRFCKLLEELFGVPFVPEIYNWDELKSGFDDYMIDFTGSINTAAGLETGYFNTFPIAGHKLSVFIKDGSREIASEYDLRGLKIGFYAGSSTEKITRDAFPRVDFESVAVSGAEEMADMLDSGEIDAFIFDTSDVFSFYQYDHIATVKMFPHVYLPFAISTANPELQPIISAITKYLTAGGIDEADRLYRIGEREYAVNMFIRSLNDEERRYIANLSDNNETIPIGASAARYPVAFYDENSDEFQGIALDILSEISDVTGIEFRVVNDKTATWTQLTSMLDTGEILLLTQIILGPAWEGRFIWPDTHYYSGRYAFLSKLDFPYLNINQVPYYTVGVPTGTADERRYNALFPEDTDYKTFTTTDEGLDALNRGEIDLFMSLDYTLLYENNFRENSGQKINILLDSSVERVAFGINKDEEVLCSIINKAQGVINTDRIVKSWTSRVFDVSKQMLEEQARLMETFIICLSMALAGLLLLYIRGQKLKRQAKTQAQTALKAQQNLHVLLDMLPVGIRIMSIDDGTLLYSNQACLKVFNCSSFEEQVKGMSGFTFMPEYQPNGRKTADMVAEFFSADTDTVIAEMQCLKLGGEPFTCRITSSTINYADHRASLAVMEDITEEEEYREMLENTALREHEANQMKSRFLAQMSHEIRTPMNAITGMAELALRGNNLDDVKEHILMVKQAGSDLLAIINDILDFSKIEAGKMEIIPKDYSVASLLNDIVNIIRTRLLDKQICFTVNADKDVPQTLYGDETRIRQAVLNILSNAVKYTEKGFVSFGVYSEFISDDTVNLIFEVMDSGIGIRQKDMDKLYTDFTQLELEKHKGIEGIGLGLAISDGFVKAMDGLISVESEYGKGSTFTITLPQKFSTHESLAAVEEPQEKSVLIYDLNERYADSLANTIKNLGVNYTPVASGVELCKEMESWTYDCLFISYPLWRENKDTILSLSGDTKTVILAEFGETVHEKNMNVLVMPVYCTFIANVLNGVKGKFSYAADNEYMIGFSAPDAKVLIVDDIGTNLKVAEGLLLPYNIQVDLASSGLEAIEAVQSEHYDIIFMDHKMPGMDGVEATRRIRALGDRDEELGVEYPHYYRDVPIIALTANAVMGMAEMFAKNGFSDFLDKPIDTVKLNVLLEKWIPPSKQK